MAMTHIGAARPAWLKKSHSPRRRAAARPVTAGRHRRRPLFEPLEGRALLSLDAMASPATPPVLAGPTPLAGPLGLGTSSPEGLNPSQIEQAYGFNDITFPNQAVPNEAGQTIAIVDAYGDPNIQADLHAFDVQFHLADPKSLTIATPPGDGPVTAPPPDSQGNYWVQETAMDVEWAHTLAPGADILLVVTPGGGPDRVDQGLIDGVNYARSQPKVSVVSMSWTEGSIRDDSVFTTPTGHTGITFIAASGDSGMQASYPAASRNVLAVGGSEFTTPPDQTGHYPPGAEQAWNGSGGGIQAGEPQPQGQSAVYNSPAGRAVPDVAFDAGNFVSVYDSYDFGTATPWVAMEGTSFGAPAWAALIALADQGRAQVGTGPLDGAGQTLPDLYAIASPQPGLPHGHLSVAFNDITRIANDPQGPDLTGYDLMTGLGTPKAAAVVAILSHDVAGPSLLSPEDQAVPPTATPTLQWSSVPGAIAYNLTVTDSATGRSAVSQMGLADTSYTIASPLPIGVYAWTVTAVLVDGQPAAMSPPARSFAVLSIPDPSGPSGIVIPTAPKFQWGPVTGAAGYHLRVFDAVTNAVVRDVPQVAGTSYTPPSPLADSTTYRWTVSAYANGKGGAAYTSPPSASAYFTIDTHVGVELESPSDYATLGGAPTFQWAKVDNAVSYTLKVVLPDNTANPPVVLKITTMDTSYQPDVSLFSAPHTYQRGFPRGGK
jgi:hypothetical protein